MACIKATKSNGIHLNLAPASSQQSRCPLKLAFLSVNLVMNLQIKGICFLIGYGVVGTQWGGGGHLSLLLLGPFEKTILELGV